MKVASLLLAVIFLSGCESRYPTDLSLVSVLAVNEPDQAELDRTFQGALISGHNIVRYLIAPRKDTENTSVTPADMEKYYIMILNNRETWEYPADMYSLPIFGSEMSDEKPHRLLLKIEFQSKVNLHEYVRDHGYSLGARVYFCQRPVGFDDLLGSGQVYWRGFGLSRLFFVTIPQDGEGQPMTYYTFVDARLDRPRAVDAYGRPFPAPYDLREKPEDVCLLVRGGSMGFGYKSSVVRIPSQTIAEALKTLPSPFDVEALPDGGAQTERDCLQQGTVPLGQGAEGPAGPPVPPFYPAPSRCRYNLRDPASVN